MSEIRSFVSENEIEAAKLKRQEEWEKIRQPDQPIEAPEEVYDARPLYNRLKEQRDKAQAEYEEAHKLKNMVRGLDDDEVGFLDFVDKLKSQEERKRRSEEEIVLNEYQKVVCESSLERQAKQLQLLQKKEISAKKDKSMSKQKAILAAAIKPKQTKRSSETELNSSQNKRMRLDNVDNPTCQDGCDNDETHDDNPSVKPGLSVSSNRKSATSVCAILPSAQHVISVLPGFVPLVTGSSDSDRSDSDSSSSDSDCVPDMQRRFVSHSAGCGSSASQLAALKRQLCAMEKGK